MEEVTDSEYQESSSGKTINISTRKAKYIRLWSNGSTANTSNHYSEVEVYGTPITLPAGDLLKLSTVSISFFTIIW